MGRARKLKQARREKRPAEPGIPMTFCMACRQTLPVSMRPFHSTTPLHQQNASLFVIGQLVMKMQGWQCPGPLVRDQRPMPWEAPVR